MDSIIKEKVFEYKENIIKDICEILKYKSVLGSAAKSKPFGSEINKCLEAFLKMGSDMGFREKNIDGYAGYLEIGTGKEMVAGICHLDVVPSGDGWRYDPYIGTIDNGRLYGRGTVDDKGPAISCLYAMKIINDLKINLSKRIRLIVGTDEESGFRGIKYYLENEETPVMGFSPDGEFPIIYAEKGILHFELQFQLEDNTTIEYIKGGNRVNMVPDYAEAKLHTKEDIPNLIKRCGLKNIKAEETDNGYILKCFGVSAHGSMPQSGVNAITSVIKILSNLNNISCESKKILKFLDEKIGFEVNGKSLGIDCEDDVSKELTLNMGIIDFNQKKGKIAFDIRYPVTKNYKDLLTSLEKSIDTNIFSLKINLHKEPLYVDKENPLIKMLSRAYETVMKEKADLIAIGGGTYCRAIKNTVAFGPVFKGFEEVAHQPNEYIEIEQVLKMTEIYTHAFINMST
jgi:succinyl-diaminopimelate desuccinylase